MDDDGSVVSFEEYPSQGTKCCHEFFVKSTKIRGRTGYALESRNGMCDHGANSKTCQDLRNSVKEKSEKQKSGGSSKNQNFQKLKNILVYQMKKNKVKRAKK